MSTCYYITNVGYEKLNQEIEDIEFKQLPIVINEVSTARGNGDLSENAEYHAAKAKQRELMRKLGTLKDFKINAKIVNIENIATDAVRFGVYVEVLNLDNDKTKTIKLVGDYESDADNNIISISSKLGEELIGKKVGDLVEFEINGKIFSYEILSIHK